MVPTPEKTEAARLAAQVTNCFFALTCVLEFAPLQVFFSIHSPRPLLAARKSRNEKGKKKTSKAKTKASFHHSAKQKGLKAKKTTGAPVEPQPEHVFCGYDLSPLPVGSEA